MAFDRNEYNKKYKKDNFDRFSFFTQKGIKEKAQVIADKKGIKLSEYIRNALLEAIERDTE